MRQDVVCDMMSCATWCHVRHHVVCEHLNWELTLCCDQAFGWYEVICELACDTRSCATLGRRGCVQPLDQLILMESSLDKTWCWVRAWSELVRCEISSTWRKVECEVEHLVNFSTVWIWLIFITHAKCISLRVYRQELMHDVKVIVSR